MRWYAWGCVLLLCAARPVAAAPDGFAHHVIAVQLAPKDEQAADPNLTDYYVDRGSAQGTLPGTQFWVYRVEMLGLTKRVVIPVARIQAFHIEDQLAVARLQALTVPADDALVEYRTIMVGDAVEPIVGTGLSPLGTRDLDAEMIEVPTGLLPPLAPGDRAERTFSIPNIVLFDFDKSTLRPEGRAILAQIAEYMRQAHAQTVRIEGHTDAIGTEAYNKGLSQRRAEAVRRYFVDTAQARATYVAVGYGESKPVASNATPAGRQRNRRCEITVNGRVPGHAEPDGLAVEADVLPPEGGPGVPAAPTAAPDTPEGEEAAAAAAPEPPFPEMARPSS